MQLLLLIFISLQISGVVFAQRVGTPTDELTKLSVDELFRIQVTSVGRKAQQLSRAPAAVFVLTADDIRRSGATSIPEALRWVPGLSVFRVDGRSWAISARGDARLYADKMLVLIDGRSLYTPLFSGVLWEFLDVPLQDIERIEVVRGPGAVMWGPNAVNGVINIITKSARSTRGAEIGVSAGNELRGSVWARWGAAPSDRLSYRLWTKLEDRNPAFGSPGYYPTDSNRLYPQAASIDNLDSKSGRVGFRLDAEPTLRDQIALAGDTFVSRRREAVGFGASQPDFAGPVSSRTTNDAGFLLARWTRAPSEGREMNLQFAYEKGRLDYPFNSGNRDNLALDFQERRQTGERNEFYWGVGFQQYRDHTHSAQSQGFAPESSVYRVGDLVLRDELQMVRSRLLVSAGIRIDYNSYTRFEYQPSLRFLYTPSTRQSAWIALSRAVRVPSRLDRDLSAGYGQRWIQGTPITLNILGSKDMRSEIERSAEAGYRYQAGQRWSLDVSVFASYYSKLRLLAAPTRPEVSFTGGAPSLSLLLQEINGGTGRSYGGEIWGMWQVTSAWRLIPSYSHLEPAEWKLPATATQTYEWMFNSGGARHQGAVRSQYDLTRNWQLDLMARARTRNLAFDTPGTLVLDARLGWRTTRQTELSFAVQNLTGRSVIETISEGPLVAIPTRRTFVFQWTQRM